MSRTYFTEAGVRRLKPPAEGQVDRFERLVRGRTLVLRVGYGGSKAWRVIFYDGNGKARAKTLGRYPALRVSAARRAALAFDPQAASAAAEAGSFKEVAEKWLRHYVDSQGLRSKREIVRKLEHYVYPRWARTPFFEIRRKTVSELLDHIVEK